MPAQRDPEHIPRDDPRGRDGEPARHGRTTGERSTVALRRRSIVVAAAAGRVVALGVVVLVLVAGCGDSSRPTATPEARPMGPENPSRPPSPQTWLDQVCTALLPAVRTGSPVPPIDPADPVGTRDRWVAYLSGRAQALTRAADGINAAGPAPLEGGQQVTEPVVALLRDRAQAATDSVGQLEAVPDNAPATLFRSVQEVQSRFVLAGPATSLRDLALTPELTRVAPAVASCREASPPP